jgi:2-dehydropantoate 2-reductase
VSEAADVVVGAGALGTLMAAALADQDREVQLVSRRAETAEAVELTVRGPTGRRARVQLRPDLPEQARLVVLATRSEDAIERARPAGEVVTDEGAVFALQNGLTPLAVAEALGVERVVPAVAGFNARLSDPTTVEVTSPGHLTVGALDPAADGAVTALRDALSRPVGATRTDNPRGAVWSKFCVSCAINGLAVVTGEGVGELTRARRGREALLAVLTEGVDLAEAEGVELERVAGPLSPDALAGNARSGLGGAFRRGITFLIGRRYRSVRPSSIAALEAGRDPELDALNAEAVRRGGEHGIATPWNRATSALAREVAAGEREPAMANLDELHERALC